MKKIRVVDYDGIAHIESFNNNKLCSACDQLGAFVLDEDDTIPLCWACVNKAEWGKIELIEN